jgi:hypothetical protein
MLAELRIRNVPVPQAATLVVAAALLGIIQCNERCAAAKGWVDLSV